MDRLRSNKLDRLRSNPINPEFATTRGRNAAAGAALAATLLLHGFMVWFLLQQSVHVQIRPPVFNVEIVRLPKPVAAVKAVKLLKIMPKAVPKPIVHVTPAPLAHIKIHGTAPHAARHMVAPAPRVMHFNGASADTGLGLGLELASPNAGTGTGSLGNFEDGVNQRIAAMNNYPPGLPPSHGFKFWNQCVVSYRLRIASNGALIGYQLYGCGNAYLDAATRADILLAAPYPPPPDFGGKEYDVYGSKIYKKPQ